MPTQKDLIIGTTIHHLRQLYKGPMSVDQHFIEPLTFDRACALAGSAMRTAAKYQAALSMGKNAKDLFRQLQSWYATDGHKMILAWQAESKTDGEMIKEEFSPGGAATPDEDLLDSGRK